MGGFSPRGSAHLFADPADGRSEARAVPVGVGSDPSSRVPVIDIEFAWNGLILAGTLHLPQGDPPHPVVLMLQGSGPADRDNDVLFPPIREAFLGRGIGGFSFDKPGVGESGGDWRHFPLESRADQALAALEVLGGHSEVDSHRLGVFGHSQGGWLAQMLARDAPNLAFAVSNSGPSIGVAAQDRYGCEHSLRSKGHTEEEISAALHFLTSIHDEARKGTDYAVLERRLLASARGEGWYGYVSLDDPDDWAFMRALISEDYEPLQALSRVACAYLAIFGGLDVLLPAWEDAWRASEAIRAAETGDVAVVVFPLGDHRMQRNGAFVPGYLDLVADWVAQRV